MNLTPGIHLDVVHRWLRKVFSNTEKLIPKENIKLSMFDYLVLAQDIRNSVLKEIFDKVYICAQYAGHNDHALCRNCSMPQALHHMKKELSSGQVPK